VSGYLCIKCSCDLVGVASWRRQGLGRAGNVFAARIRSFEGYHQAIRPLQLYANGGYQLRIRSLEGTPNYGPRQQPIKAKAKKQSSAMLKRPMGL
jgi:hypothetical protein